MNISAAPRLWGMTIFCDDLRQEAQGTLNIIGMYTGQLLINAESFPIIMPKFAMLIRIFEDASNYLTDNAILKIFFPGDSDEKASYEQLLAFSRRKNAQMKYPPGEVPIGVDKVVTTMIPIVFSPVQFAAAGVIKIRLHCEDTEYRLGAISVLKGQSNFVASPSSVSPLQSPLDGPAS